MRIRLEPDAKSRPPEVQLPTAGTVLHPTSNLAEWGFVALDREITLDGRTFNLLWLRPTLVGDRIGDPKPVPVHIALVKGQTVVDGKLGYTIDRLVGRAVCQPEDCAD